MSQRAPKQNIKILHRACSGPEQLRVHVGARAESGACMVGSRRKLEDGQDHRVVSGHRAGGLRTRALHDLKLESIAKSDQTQAS